jgi:putative cell wall-binding protein
VSVRKSWRLSAAAVASATLAALTFAPQADATTPGVPASSPLTVTHGSGSLEILGQTHSAVAVPYGGRDVAWSPDGSKIAFVANGQIFTANANGSGAQVVAWGAAPDAHPVWAYAGQVLVFAGWDVSGGAAASGPTQLMVTWSNGSATDTSSGTPNSWPMPKAAVPGFADSAPDYGVGTLAFARTKLGTAGGADTADGVWIRSEAANYVPYQVAATGTAPTVSPDGKTVAFVQADADGVAQIWTVPTAAPAGGTPAAPVQQTFNTKAGLSEVSNPAFSPDGKTIAFEQTHSAAPGTPGTVVAFSVAVNTDPKATANAETAIPTAALDGTERLSYRSEYGKQVFRMAGADRLGTAQAVSQSQWRTNGDTADQNRSQADVAVLSRSDLPADALAGSALAAQKNGPLLLTSSTTLSAPAKAELKRILAPGSRVYLLGGTQALSPAVASAVQALGFHVVRIAGDNRYATAVQIAQTITPSPTSILLATGDDFADALSAGAAAGSTPRAVVVLSDNNRMPAETSAYLHHFGTDFSPTSNILLTAVGGQALTAIDSQKLGYWRLPLVGKDRYQTSYLVAKTFFATMNQVGVATGTVWPDALSGGAAMGSMGGPLLLVNPATGISPQDAALLDTNRGELYYGWVFGGNAAVPAGVDKQLAQDIAGPLGVLDGSGNRLAAAHTTAQALRDLTSALPGGPAVAGKPSRP